MSRSAAPAPRLLEQHEWRRAFEIQADAFSEDPFMSWVVRGRTREERERKLLGFFLHYADTPTFRRNYEVWADPDFIGSAVWARPPGKHALGLVEQLRMLPGLIRLLGRGTLHALGGLEALEKQHPTDRPHWYLLSFAVRRARQGRGLGSALLGSMLAQLDAAGQSAYLESSNPRNIGLYQRHGFRVMRELRSEGMPLVTAMWRDPVAG